MRKFWTVQPALQKLSDISLMSMVQFAPLKAKED